MVFPNGLKKGDTIGIIAPSAGANLEYIDLAIMRLEKLGLKVIEGQNIRNTQYLVSDTRKK